MALAMPYNLFEGHLTFRRDGKNVDQELRSLCQHIKQMQISDDLSIDFDVTSMDFDIGQGLFFESTIPQGFGVGSSGALCAALLHRYTKEDINLLLTDTNRLKVFFAKMESHFHGASSGMDPLISFINRPILFKGKGELIEVQIPERKNKDGAALFLLNTGRARRTEPLVNLFLEKCKTSEFAKICEGELVKVTHDCINNFLEGNSRELFYSWKKLSQIQLENLTPMIPKLYIDLWKEGLKDTRFALKLCGAGGGGFLLGMAENLDLVKKLLSSHEIRPVYFF